MVSRQHCTLLILISIYIHITKTIISDSKAFARFRRRKSLKTWYLNVTNKEMDQSFGNLNVVTGFDNASTLAGLDINPYIRPALSQFANAGLTIIL